MKSLQRLSILTLISLGMFGLCLAMRAEAGDKTIPEHYPVTPQSQSQSSSANASQSVSVGTGAVNVSENQVKQSPTVFAPDSFPTAPCRIGGSGGASIVGGGLSFGASRLDTECNLRETARSFAALGQVELAYRILCATEAVKTALKDGCPAWKPVEPSKGIAAPAPPQLGLKEQK